MLQREYKRRGLVATPEEIAEAIQNFPPPQLQTAEQFQTEGKFDLAKYQRWLASGVGQQYVPLLEAQYRDQILQSKLLRVVTADVYLSDPALWQLYRDQNETATIELAAILPRRAIPDSAVQVSDEEIQAYYKAHPDQFKRPPTAYLSFVALPRLTDASDSAAAYQRALAVRQEILDGAPFAEIAARESSDSVSASQGRRPRRVDAGLDGRGLRQRRLLAAAQHPVHAGAHRLRLSPDRGRRAARARRPRAGTS